MNKGEDFIKLVTASDGLASLRNWVRMERQRAHLTQSELAVKSNVPATTISRLERTGLSSTEALLRVLFALDALDSLHDFLKERLRLCAFPKSLSDGIPGKPVIRIRHRKGVRP